MPTPRDFTHMGRSSQTGRYTGLGIAAIFVIGFLIFFMAYQPAPNAPVNSPTAPVTQPK